MLAEKLPLEMKLTGRVARFDDRREDWSVFGFETARDPRYARAQRRYLGASGSVDPEDLRGATTARAIATSRHCSPSLSHYVRNMPTPNYWSCKQLRGEVCISVVVCSSSPVDGRGSRCANRGSGASDGVG